MADDQETNQGGRPELWSQDLADQFCGLIAIGYSLRTACREEAMPSPSTVYRWIRQHEGFREQYARACEDRVDAMSEDILDIADDGSNDFMEVERKDGSTYEVVNSEALQRSRLRVDTRKWLMAKVKPKKYGDKLDLTSDGEKLPAPIYGGMSVDTNRPTGPSDIHIPGHDSNEESLPA